MTKDNITPLNTYKYKTRIHTYLQKTILQKITCNIKQFSTNKNRTSDELGSEQNCISPTNKDKQDIKFVPVLCAHAYTCKTINNVKMFIIILLKQLPLLFSSHYF